MVIANEGAARARKATPATPPPPRHRNAPPTAAGDPHDAHGAAA